MENIKLDLNCKHSIKQEVVDKCLQRSIQDSLELQIIKGQIQRQQASTQQNGDRK